MSDRPMRQKQSVSQIVLFVHNQTTIVKIISIASKRWKPIASQPGAEEAKIDLANCQMLCKIHNRMKGNK